MKESKVAGRAAVYAPWHPAANSSGYVLKARFIVEQRLGRLLEPEEQVHHINGDKTDDRDENLTVLTPEEHAKHHYTAQNKIDRLGRPRSLDYDLIEEWVKQGYGYKKIAELTGFALTSVRYAVRIIRGRIGNRLVEEKQQQDDRKV